MSPLNSPNGALPLPQFQKLFDNLLEGFQIITPDWKYLYVNETVSRQGKKSKEELIGKTMLESYPGIEHTEMFAILRDCMENRKPREMENLFSYPDGSKAWFELRFEPVPEGVFILSLDITERKMAEEKLNWMIYHEDSTGLPNQRSLLRSLELELEYGKDKSNSGALILISLKNSMEIESAFGSSSKDELLFQLEQHIEILLPNCKIFKANSNQLALLIRSSLSNQLEYILSDIRSAIRMPCQVGNLSLHGDFCVGYVRLNNQLQDTESYLRAAKVAAIAACKSKLTLVEFDSNFENKIKDNLEIMGELKQALESGNVDFHYQPKVQLENGSVIGVEALIRWEHHTYGQIPPSKFIVDAEKSANIHLITQLALARALERNAQWRELGIFITTAVNISTQNLLMPNFVDSVLELLEIYQIPCESLELEITEGELMSEPERCIQELSRLRDANICVSIDDFGTGYSSLQYLNELPVSHVKLDKSFIKDLPLKSRNTYITASTIELCKNLGIKIVAEGVETPEAYNFLRDIGCDYAQGFYIGHPMGAGKFREWYSKSGGIFLPQTPILRESKLR